MSRLEKLIRELCPDGVEYNTIGNCVTKIDKIKWSEHKRDAFRYIDLTSVDRNTHLIAEVQTITSENAPSRAQQIVCRNDILLGATRPLLKRYCMVTDAYNGEICSTGFCVLRANESVVLSRYLYHVVSSSAFFLHVELFQKGASYPAISDADVKKYSFPVPPLEVQREIVRILDTFTTLTAELQAELQARKKQYRYYSQKLFERNKKEYRRVPLSELGKWHGGKTPSMQEKRFWENGTIPWISSKDMKAPVLSDTQDHITEIAITDASMNLLPAESVAIVTRSGILKHTFPVAYVPFRTTINQDIKALTVAEGVSARYVSFALQAYSEDIRTKTKKLGGTVDSLDFQKVLRYEIPLPEYEVQQRIVRVLDNFEAICSDLNIGLPAEIEARQKQYEYYRDKLLTFKEKA